MNSWGKSLATVILASAMVAATGCSTSTESAQESSASATIAPVTTAASEDTASVPDYLAAKLSAHRSLDGWLTDWEDSGCFGSVVTEDPICTVQMTTAGMIVGTVDSTLRGMQKPGVPAYVGPPPTELVGAVEDSEEALADAIATTEEWDAARCPAADHCVGLALRAEMAMDSLNDSLDAWELYK